MAVARSLTMIDAALTVSGSSSHDGNKDTRSLVILQTLREHPSIRASNLKSFECSRNRRTYRNGVVVDTFDSSSRKDNARKKFRIRTGGAEKFVSHLTYMVVQLCFVRRGQLSRCAALGRGRGVNSGRCRS